MPFFDRDGSANESYSFMRFKDIGSIGTHTSVTDFDFDNAAPTPTNGDRIGGFVMQFEHEILSGGTQYMGMRLFEDGAAITNYGSAYREDGTVVSGKSTSWLQLGTNTSSNSGFDVVSCTAKIWMPPNQSGFGNWVVAEIMNFNDNVGFDKYYYKFQIDDAYNFDYKLQWAWQNSTTQMSLSDYEVWYIPLDTNHPAGF